MAQPAPTEILTYRQWRRLATQKRAPARASVLIGRAAEAQPLEGEARRVRFLITTGEIDRYNDTIDPAGWSWDNWERAGAPVFYQHMSWDLPVAQGVDTAAERGGIASTADFGAEGEDEFGDRLYELCRRGRVRGASVGFMPLEWSYDEEREGFNIQRAELIEWSVTPTPANPEAVQLALRAFARGAAPRRRASAPTAEAVPSLPPPSPAPGALTHDAVRRGVRAAIESSVHAAVARATGRLEE